jgi:hypothetical protein
MNATLQHTIQLNTTILYGRKKVSEGMAVNAKKARQWGAQRSCEQLLKSQDFPRILRVSLIDVTRLSYG